MTINVEKRWWQKSTKSFVAELSEIEDFFNIAVARHHGFSLLNSKTGKSIQFKFSHADKDEDIYGWHFIPVGNAYGVKDFLIIND